MARIAYVPHDADREDQKVEERAERRLSRNEPVPDDVGDKDPDSEEYASVEAFVDGLYEDDEDSFDHRDLGCLNARLGVATHVLRRALESYGLKLETRKKDRAVRGFKAYSHDRWFGAGSSETHGGGGGGSIYGMCD